MSTQDRSGVVWRVSHVDDDQPIPSSWSLCSSNGPENSVSDGSLLSKKAPKSEKKHAKSGLKLDSRDLVHNTSTGKRTESRRYKNTSDPQYTFKSLLSNDSPPAKVGKSSETLGSGHSAPSSKSSRSIRTLHHVLHVPKRRSSLAGSPGRLDIGDGNHSLNGLSQLFLTRRVKKVPKCQSTSEPPSSQMSDPPSLSGHQRSNAIGSLDSSTVTSPGSGSMTGKRKTRPRGIDNPDMVEGLYCRIRRQLGLKKGPAGRVQTGDQDPTSRSSTNVMLDQATGLLRSYLDEKRNTGSFSTTSSTLSIAAVDDRHHGGLFPRGANKSASSSLRNIFMDKLHHITPDPTAFYTGSDNEQYFRVQIGTPEAPSFLPSEATRVGTPPLPYPGSSGDGRRLRGFFFDYRLPDKHSPESPRGAGPAFSPRPDHSPRPHPKNSPTTLLEKDNWFRMKQRVETNTFKLNVPDHLPSSPLCPRNPKHSSGGKGICVYHGRAKIEPPPISKHNTRESQKSGKGTLKRRASDA